MIVMTNEMVLALCKHSISGGNYLLQRVQKPFPYMDTERITHCFLSARPFVFLVASLLKVANFSV